jgi:hypothetical protein
MSLTDAQIRALKPKDKAYKRFLGNGLYVLVHPNGSKYWRVKYRFAGRERVYSIGVFEDVDVSAATEALEMIRSMAREGTDPAEVKRQAAKATDKPVSNNVFCLALSLKGSLTIETDTKLVTLTPSQTKALRDFLVADQQSEVET